MFDFDVNKSFSFLGVFWIPSAPDNKIFGELSYDSEIGLSLKIIFHQFSEMSDFPKKIQYLFGECEEIGSVSLFNCTNIGKAIGNVFIRKYQVFYALTNIHYADNAEAFNGFSFHFNELNAFCSNNDSFSVRNNQPLIDCNLKQDYHFSLHEGFKDGFYLNDIFPSEEKEALFGENKDKLKDLIVSKPFFYISVKKKGLSFSDCFKDINRIEKLFRLLMLRPVSTTYCMLKSSKGSHRLIMKPLQSGKDKNSTYRFYLPFRIYDIADNFSEIWAKWEDVLGEMKLNALIVEKFFNERNFGHISCGVIISAIREWQEKHGQDTTQKTSLEKFLEENLSEQDELSEAVREKIKEYCGTDDIKEIQEFLSNLRATFLHENKLSEKQTPKEIASAVASDATMRNLSEILFLLLIRAVLRHLGVMFSQNTNHLLSFHVPNWTNISF